jgi:thimet oligopeptidase
MDSIVEPLLSAGPAELQAACSAALTQARSALARFKALPLQTPFETVVDAWDAVGRPLNGIGGACALFFQVHPDEAVREQAATVEQELSRFGTELSLDRQAWERLAALDLGAAADPIARRVVEHALRDFRRAGVDKDAATRERVRALREELVEIGQEFSRNIAGDRRTLRIPEGRAGLEGLPEDWIEAHPPEADGSVTLSTDPTDYQPFMKYARHRGHREALYRVYMLRGTPGNLPVLERMIARRHELATLLGFRSWADYATEDKMIKTAARAAEFIGRVTDLTARRMEREVEELREQARQDRPGPGAEELRDWDRNYDMEQLRRRRFDFDGRQARPYFAYEHVRDGVLDVASRLYGLTITKRPQRAWHPDVETYDLSEAGRPVARFYLDMHPRPDKFKHAAMFDLVSGVDGQRLPEAALVCNLPRPTGADPGLLEPGEVTTVFHEFGHLLHHLLAGRQRWLSVSGITTEWDFVEVPSQLFEEWGRDATVLQRFARHHETGEPIPLPLIERMRAADEFGKGLATRVQMFYAALALEYFRSDPAGLDTTEVVRRLKAHYVPYPYEEGSAPQASFGHLEGYSALYYTYMWSLVLAKDLLGAFGGNLLDADTARRYRRCVLEPGGSQDAEVLVASFLGRPFAFDAFERWLAA